MQSSPPALCLLVAEGPLLSMSPPCACLCSSQAFFYFPLAEILQQKFFNNTDWTELRGSARRPHDCSTYLGTENARRIDRLTGGKLMDPTSGLLEIGFDFGQVFNFIDHSVGVFAVRWAASAQRRAAALHGGYACVAMHTIAPLCILVPLHLFGSMVMTHGASCLKLDLRHCMRAV